MAHLRDGEQLGALQAGAGPGRGGMAMAPEEIASSIRT